MTDARPIPCRPRFLATDAVLLGTLALFTLLALVFHAGVDNWTKLALANLVVAGVYLTFAWLARRAANQTQRFFLRMVPVALAYGYLFLAVDKLQLILTGGWMDPWVLQAEQSIFGIQPTFWLEDLTLPALTEWLMLSYLFYFVLYPVACAVVFVRRGERAMEQLLFALAVTNVLCDLCFILFPVAGPMAMLGGDYTTPLTGSVCAVFGEWVRTHLQYPGGSLPSPHCAAATVMWLMVYRSSRVAFWTMMPLVLSLYVSTVYCRYHYVSDAVSGIGLALVVLAVAGLWARGKERRA